MGCGEARLAASVRQRVLSYDLVALNDRVTATDMAHLPLEDGAANVAVLCLALMGTNIADFLIETNRVLKMGSVHKAGGSNVRYFSGVYSVDIRFPKLVIIACLSAD